MAITETITKCPLTQYDYLPFFLQQGDQTTRDLYYSSVKTFKDSSWPGGVPPRGKSVIYFGGSSTKDYLAPDSPIVVAVLAAGYTLHNHLVFLSSHTDVSKNPYHGYGQVANPNMFGGNFITGALHIARALAALNVIDNTPKILVGHSRGSAGILTYLGMRSSFGNDANFVHGAVMSAPAAAGNGQNKWNGSVRILSAMNILFAGLEGMPENSVIALWGNQDAYCPPAMVHRFRYNMKPGNKTYLISVGDYGHNWMSTATMPTLIRHINAVANRIPPTLNDGTTATPGRGF